jgi:hypothetical protein
MPGDGTAVESQSRRQSWWWLPEKGLARTALEFLIIIPAYVLYSLVRGTVDGRAPEAIGRAIRIIDVEQGMGIFWEPELQQLIVSWGVAVRAVNTIYVWGHLPLLIGIAVWLFVCHRHRYPVFRNAFLISGGIALLLFWLLPTAPPRYFQYWGFVDTAVESGSYYIFQSPAFVNQYAAMPSLHFGWSLLAAAAVYLHLRAPYRYIAFAMPVLNLAGIVLTGNHFFLDAAAGGAVAMFALWLAMQLHLRLPRQKPFTILA